MRTDATAKGRSSAVLQRGRLATVLVCLAAMVAPQKADAQSRSRYSPYYDNPYTSSFWSSGFFWPQPYERMYRRPVPPPTPRRESRPKPAPAPAGKPSAGVVAIPFPAPTSAPAHRDDAAAAAQGPLVAVISLASQRMQVYGASGEIADTRISTGKPGHTTPTGVFSIIQRNRFHNSNLYSNAPMPYMQRLTWSGIALHEGVLPGYPASHGCVRLPTGFASRLWSMGRLGMRVVIAPTDVQPGTIESSRLPTPLFGSAGVANLQPLLQTISAPAVAPDIPQKQLSPLALAHAKRSQALADKTAAERDVKSTAAQAAERSSAANKIGDRLRVAVARLATLEEEHEERQREFARVQTEEAESRLAAALSDLRKRVDAAKADVADLKILEIAASDAAFEAAKIAREARERLEAASDAVQAMRTALEPISILVSRKDGMVFVRQGFRDIHQEPIAIEEPTRAIGTHVFTAMSASDGGETLNWQVVTVPSRERAEGAPIASTPTSALGRFTLPTATLQLVRERLWPGASLIVSDQGLGPETGAGTDFVVLTR